MSLPAIKSIDVVPQSSRQPQSSASSAVHTKAAPVALDGYKLVKVRKPDGTVRTVRRPIGKDLAAGVPTPGTFSKDGGQATSEQSMLPGKQQAQEVAMGKSSEAPSGATPGKTETIPKAADVTPKKNVVPLAHTSKFDAVSKSSRIFRRFRRVHKHASRFAEAVNPYSDVGEYEDGDVSVSEESDDDDDSQSDGSDTSQNGQQKNKSGSGKVAQAATSASHHVINNRAAPATKQTQTSDYAHRLPESKSTSAELSKDALVLEKEILPSKSSSDVKPSKYAAKSLTKRSTQWGKLIVWSLTILLPLAFIGLGIATSTLNKQPTNNPRTYGDDYDSDEQISQYPQSNKFLMIHYATKAAITAWPIVFAAILAQTLKAFATYQVERGIRLMTLEQLISSHSVASALKQPFVLRKINWITFGLLGLWSLSPLGSQAMQYTTRQYPHMTEVNGTIWYLNTTQENPGLSSAWEAVEKYSDSMDILYAAVFQQPSQYQPNGSDPWGNALIPVYEYLESKEPGENITVDPSRVANWSSYYGIPLATFNGTDADYDGSWVFTMNSSYLFLNCPSLSWGTLNQTGQNISQLSTTTSGSLYMGMTVPTTLNPIGNVIFLSTCTGPQAPDFDDQVFAYSICNFTQTFVGSTVSCTDTDCAVMYIQNAPSHDPVPMMDFIGEFLKSSDVGLSNEFNSYDHFSITELYLRNSSNATEPGSDNYCDLSALKDDPVQFSQSLSYLINSFYSTGFTHDFSVGTITQNDYVDVSSGPDNGTQRILLTSATNDARHLYQSETSPYLFSIDWLFMSIYEFCSLALLLIGIAGVLLESRTIAPDILGFASSVARHSKYVKLPHVDGTMSGGERAKMLGDVRVMMQDVRPDDEVGKIVLGTVNESAQRLRPGKLYR